MIKQYKINLFLISYVCAHFPEVCVACSIFIMEIV